MVPLLYKAKWRTHAASGSGGEQHSPRSSSSCPSPGITRDINEWDEGAVYQWMCTLGPGFEQYEKKLKENGITGDTLVLLNQDELKEIGISSVGHRLSILKAVYQIKVAQHIPIEPDQYVPPSESIASATPPPTEPQEQPMYERILALIEQQNTRLAALEQENYRLHESLDELLSKSNGGLPSSDSAGAQEKQLRRQPSVKWAPYGSDTSPAADMPDFPHLSPEAAEHDIPGRFPGDRKTPTRADRPSSARERQFPRGERPPSRNDLRRPSTSAGHSSGLSTPVSGRPDIDRPHSRTDGRPSTSGHTPSSASLTPNTDRIPGRPSSRTDIREPERRPSTSGAALPTASLSPEYARSPQSAVSQTSGEENMLTPITTITTSGSIMSSGLPSSIPTASGLMPHSALPHSATGNGSRSKGSRRGDGMRDRVGSLHSLEDPCWKVLPAALKKYNIKDDWQQYALFISYGPAGGDRCLNYDEKPLLLFSQLKERGKNPVFMLRHIKDIKSPIAISEEKAAKRSSASKVEHGGVATNGPLPSPLPPSKGDRPPQLLRSKASMGLDQDEMEGGHGALRQGDEIETLEEPVSTIAIYPHIAEQADEFDVKMGDSFIILQRFKGWWVAQRDLSGDGVVDPTAERGWVPAGCLLELTSTRSLAFARLSRNGRTPNGDPALIPMMASSITSTQFPAFALKDYQASGKYELTLRKGDALRVFKRYNHWAYAIKDATGERGWYPSWYVARSFSSGGVPDHVSSGTLTPRNGTPATTPATGPGEGPSPLSAISTTPTTPTYASTESGSAVDEQAPSPLTITYRTLGRSQAAVGA
ncbi:hypothetical protein DACRYDRAFT_114911 [Dacryopinax primogenitus]|uniref:RA-domain-containing protein n=1 Tax=Dacryopinax primogenitus (strain DJM 731) TaxID=1858805 RepID=M5GES0_DACPD|nr:uncharacterized protein DACRYDRAFT_114911 [Dacryopinax primogenitus]EJU03528.1 hypothetical protein DACRYDRAFT_114911 [Dacryopinax primogenitus]